MTPEMTNLIAAICIFVTTIATITQVIVYDMCHHRSGKAKRLNLILWMILTGAIFNTPFIYKAVSGLNNL